MTPSIELLAAISRAYALTENVPSYHPSVTAALAAVGGLLHGAESLHVEIVGGRLYPAGGDTDDVDGQAPELARDLEALGVTALRLPEFATPDDVHRFIALLRTHVNKARADLAAKVDGLGRVELAFEGGGFGEGSVQRVGAGATAVEDSEAGTPPEDDEEDSPPAPEGDREESSAATHGDVEDAPPEANADGSAASPAVEDGSSSEDVPPETEGVPVEAESAEASVPQVDPEPPRSQSGGLASSIRSLFSSGRLDPVETDLAPPTEEHSAEEGEVDEGPEPGAVEPEEIPDVTDESGEYEQVVSRSVLDAVATERSVLDEPSDAIFTVEGADGSDDEGYPDDDVFEELTDDLAMAGDPAGLSAPRPLVIDYGDLDDGLEDELSDIEAEHSAGEDGPADAPGSDPAEVVDPTSRKDLEIGELLDLELTSIWDQPDPAEIIPSKDLEFTIEEMFTEAPRDPHPDTLNESAMEAEIAAGKSVYDFDSTGGTTSPDSEEGAPAGLYDSFEEALDEEGLEAEEAEEAAEADELEDPGAAEETEGVGEDSSAVTGSSAEVDRTDDDSDERSGDAAVAWEEAPQGDDGWSERLASESAGDESVTADDVWSGVLDGGASEDTSTAPADEETAESEAIAEPEWTAGSEGFVEPEESTESEEIAAPAEIAEPSATDEAVDDLWGEPEDFAEVEGEAGLDAESGGEEVLDDEGLEASHSTGGEPTGADTADAALEEPGPVGLGGELLRKVRAFVSGEGDAETWAEDIRWMIPGSPDSEAVREMSEAIGLLVLHPVPARREEGMRLAGELAIEPAVHELVVTLGSELDEARKADKVKVLAGLGERAANALAEALEDDEHRGARRNYMDALTQMGPTGLDRMADMADDPRWYVARNAVTMLGELGSEEAVVHITAALAHMDARVRREAVQALGKLGGEASGLLLVGMLGDPDAQVRASSARAVGLLQVEKALRSLVDALESESEDDVQIAMLRALGQLGDPGPVHLIEKKALGSFLSRPPRPVRIAAYQALFDIGTPHARTLLEQALKDRDGDVREAVRELLAKAD